MNQSKKRDPRFHKRWGKVGAIGTIETARRYHYFEKFKKMMRRYPEEQRLSLAFSLLFK